MKDNLKIKDFIRTIAGSEPEIIQGIVNQVHSNGTFDIEADEGVIAFGIRTNVVMGVDAGIQLTPEVNSPVIVARIEGGNQWQLVQSTKLKAIRIRIGAILFEMNPDQIKMNEGKQGGIVLAAQLKRELKRQKANENVLKGAITQLAASIEALVPGTSALIQTQLSSITAYQLDDVENPKIAQ